MTEGLKKRKKKSKESVLCIAKSPCNNVGITALATQTSFAVLSVVSWGRAVAGWLKIDRWDADKVCRGYTAEDFSVR